MAILIKGENLTEAQRREVLSAYIYRHLDTTSKTDDDWIKKHAFYFVKDGSRLAANRHHCEPSWMADTETA